MRLTLGDGFALGCPVCPGPGRPTDTGYFPQHPRATRFRKRARRCPFHEQSIKRVFALCMCTYKLICMCIKTKGKLPSVCSLKEGNNLPVLAIPQRLNSFTPQMERIQNRL